MPQAQPRLPAPAAADWAAHRFVPAAKRIHTAEQLKQFLQSQAASDFVGFILALNEAIKGKQLSDPCHVSEAVAALLAALDTLWRWVDETPPAAHTLRYGNPAFRTWFARMAQTAQELMAGVLPQGLQGAAVELAGYFADSFGNPTRIDYGTGGCRLCAVVCCCAWESCCTKNGSNTRHWR